MVDIHCHLIPTVDDGCSSFREALSLLKKAKEDGITDICITPHFSRVDDYTAKANIIVPIFHQLKELAKNIDIRLYIGNELMIGKDLDELLLSHELLTLNDSKYVLVEFPFNEYKSIYDEYLYNISLSGYKIIIAHPERYEYVYDDVDKYIYHKWVNKGYYLQCNQSSLYDRHKRNLIYDLIETQAIHIISSDGHNKQRPVVLKQGYELIKDKFSSEVADTLFTINPKLVLSDRELIDVPETRRKNIFGF